MKSDGEDMTDLERRALLGDRQAQDECTRKGIVLPCPFCGGKADKVVCDAAGMFVCKKCKIYKPFTLVIDGARKALTVWNTRPAPPIGRCVGCKYYNGLAECELLSECGGTNWFCGWFEPKEREENERTSID